MKRRGVKVLSEAKGIYHCMSQMAGAALCLVGSEKMRHCLSDPASDDF